jgi:hypothetical protein
MSKTDRFLKIYGWALLIFGFVGGAHYFYIVLIVLNNLSDRTEGIIFGVIMVTWYVVTGIGILRRTHYSSSSKKSSIYTRGKCSCTTRSSSSSITFRAASCSVKGASLIDWRSTKNPNLSVQGTRKDRVPLTRGVRSNK